MASKNDNHNTYMPGHTKVAHHEWRTAENSAAYLLPTLHSKAHSNPKLTLLDIGCGSGTITATLAKYMPGGHITAVDISSDILETAGKYAEKHGVRDQITFQTADVYALPYGDNTFDVVHASQVLAHLDSPVQAYKEMLRVTKAGGVVANRESDISMWSYYPDLPGLKKYHDIMLEVMKGSGGNPRAGPRLIGWARQAGAPRSNITATMGTWMYSSREEREMWGGSLADRLKGGGMTDKIRELGLASEEEMEMMGKAWEEWIEREDACHGSMHGEVLIRK